MGISRGVKRKKREERTVWEIFPKSRYGKIYPDRLLGRTEK